MNNKKCLFSILSKSHIKGFKVFSKSLLKLNPWVEVVGLEILIVPIDLNEEDKKTCEEFYKNIIWIDADKSLINKSESSAKIGASAHFKLQAFNIPDYETVISIDCADMLFTGDISQLFSYNTHIGMVQGWTPVAKWQQFNGGLVVLSKKFRNKETYEKIKSQPSSYMHDQDIINNLFKGEITKLPTAFNFSKRMIECKEVDIKDAKIIHFVGENPWEEYPEKNKFKNIERLWQAYV